MILKNRVQEIRSVFCRCRQFLELIHDLRVKSLRWTPAETLLNVLKDSGYLQHLEVSIIS